MTYLLVALNRSWDRESLLHRLGDVMCGVLSERRRFKSGEPPSLTSSSFGTMGLVRPPRGVSMTVVVVVAVCRRS